jgi:hypothetical protein
MAACNDGARWFPNLSTPKLTSLMYKYMGGAHTPHLSSLSLHLYLLLFLVVLLNKTSFIGELELLGANLV